MKKFRVEIFLTVILFSLPLLCCGATKTWTGVIDNDYDNPDNWSPVGVPEDFDKVIIPASSNNPVIFEKIESTQYNPEVLRVENGAELLVQVKNTISIYNIPGNEAGLYVEGKLVLYSPLHVIQQGNNFSAIVCLGTIENYNVINLNDGFFSLELINGVFYNYGQVNMHHSTSNQSIVLQGSAAQFHNDYCALVYLGHPTGSDHADQIFRNDGYLEYTSTINSNFLVAQFTGSGYQYDPNNTFEDGNNEIVSMPYSYNSTIFVDESAFGNKSGTDWINAFNRLQMAIDYSCFSAMFYDTPEIWIADGYYVPNRHYDATTTPSSDDRNKTFFILKDVQLFGGFNGDETLRSQRDPYSYPVYLSGDVGSAIDSTDNSYHVLYFHPENYGPITDSCLLSGITIQDGNASGTGAEGRGGGFYNYGFGGSQPRFSNCIFRNNSAVDGGVFYNYAIGNDAGVKFVNCTFYNNAATDEGGVGYNYGFGRQATVTAINCTFSKNKVPNGTAGILFNSGALGTASGAFYNSILWDNADEIVNSGGSASSLLDYCAFDDGTPDAFLNLPSGTTATNSSDADPQFVAPGSFDLRLKRGSPYIDDGDDTQNMESKDLDGFPRISSVIDLGAYENHCPLSGSLPILVDTDATGNDTGLDWPNAMNNLQKAIDQSCRCSDDFTTPQVWIAEGSYFPTRRITADGFSSTDPRAKSFYINKNVRIYGGFSGSETALYQRNWRQHATILDGNIGDAGDTLDNAHHVVIIDGSKMDIDSTCLLDGLHITNGVASGSRDFLADKGGGIYIYGGSSTICTPTLTNLSLTNNRSSQNGGGIYLGPLMTAANIYSCIFSGNQSQFGGAISISVNALSSQSLLSNNLFYSNSATDGGAIYMFSRSDAFPSISNSTFVNNQAILGTGGALNFNPAPGNPSPRVSNSIFWENTASHGGPHIYGDNPEVDYCLIQGGYPGGTNIIDSDPLFEDATSQNYRLTTASPARNTGQNSYVPDELTADLDGKVRIMYHTVDIGAYEFYQCPNSGQSIFVDIDVTSGDSTGLSWTNAMRQLQSAIDLACNCYSDSTAYPIWVAEGTYYPTKSKSTTGDPLADPRAKTFYINKNIQLFGGFNGTETELDQRNWEQYIVKLDGDLGTQSDKNDNTYHVLIIDGSINEIDSTCQLDGFHVWNGFASGSEQDENGGGLYIHGGTDFNCTPILNNLFFAHNESESKGGAIYIDGANNRSSAIIGKSQFFNNQSDFGGAISLYSTNNMAPSTVIQNCLFANNIAGSSGGAIDNFSFLTDANCVIVNSTFAYNQATIVGGSLHDQSYHNTLLAANNIFWNNTANLNDPNIASEGTIAPVVDFCLIQGGYPNGTNIIDSDPLFEDIATSNYRLKAASPARNAGLNNYIEDKTTMDLAGEQRILFETVDLGAYEFYQCPDSGQPIYVDIDAINGDSTGGTWIDAFRKVQSAIELSCVCNSDYNTYPIWVAEGTYYPTLSVDLDSSGVSEEREKTFYIPKVIELYGGFNGTEVTINERNWNTHISKLTGDIGILGDTTDNSYHVVTLDLDEDRFSDGMTIDGFTISDGNADKTLTIHYNGGGILGIQNTVNSELGPSIRNCIIEDNYAYAGGGIFFQSSLNGMTISACAFNTNVADYGAGICTDNVAYLSILETHFNDNFSWNDGGASYHDNYFGTINRMNYSDCTFDNNRANRDGGAIVNRTYLATSIPKVTGCLFQNNTAGSDGGAILNSSKGGPTNPVFINSIFQGNNATGNGGVLVNKDDEYGTLLPHFINCTLFGNSATGEGGAVYNQQDPDGEVTTTFSNSILWQNEDEIAGTGTQHTKLNNCILDDGVPNGNLILPDNVSHTNSLELNPRFINTATFDLRLKAYSPAINRGNNDSIPAGILHDFYQNLRIADTTVDIGAHEYPEGDCPDAPVLDASYSPLVGSYTAKTSITLSGNHTIKENKAVIFDAPDINLMGSMTNEAMGLLTIMTDGCD